VENDCCGDKMHVGIVMDGNRRYAKKRGIAPNFRGHLYGKKSLERFLKYWIKMEEPKYISLFAFSLYNLKNRNFVERAFLFKLIEGGFRELLETEEIFDDKIRISFLGNRRNCPKSLKGLMKKIENATKSHNGKFLNFCVCYDGQEEIVNSFNSMMKNGMTKADDAVIKKYLYTKNLPPVDLMIRTGGEKRISGFLLWDISYAELIFREKTWPEYTPKMFENDLKEFGKRKRKFGK